MKQVNLDWEVKEEEYKELVKDTMKSVQKLQEESQHWKEKSVKYKEMAARGHLVGEKRASLCVGPSDESLSQIREQLERERAQKTELKEKIQILEDKLHQSEIEAGKRLEEEKRRWVTHSTDRENEFHLKIAHLEEKIVQEKENRIKVHEIFQFVYVATDLYLISFRNWNLN